ncbi:MAG: transporter substrate-binding domain-containing protein [Boseongicola sp.]|nr:transporter substrate-binding domain-containing protein [Boseongicola sp.]MDD9978581.1 transporter substrate-binding domain-containing protein [Boseongicola sp.]
MRILNFVFVALISVFIGNAAKAQDTQLNFLTIERPPFAFEEGGKATGFSIELMRELANGLGREVSFTFVNDFSGMLASVASGEVDGAAANISITSAREAEMDFTQPIYASGLQIMVSGTSSAVSIWDIIFRWELLAWVLMAFGALFVLGMLMYALERKQQPYFDQAPKEAMFPSFWWALNLVINGGFEVNVPRTILGRILGVFMVISSLFVVSIFVANITASLTVEAITGSIQSLGDLDGRRVGTTSGSTASNFLGERDIAHQTYPTYLALIAEFEENKLDAVVFDGPILAYYLQQNPTADAQLLERIFRPEDYGIALPPGSDLREPINRILLRLAETGGYSELSREWFGN